MPIDSGHFSGDLAVTTTHVDFTRLVESSPTWGEPIDITEFLRDTPGFATSSFGLNATQIYDREDGRYRPVYNSEIDLRMIRAMSWLLYERVPMARAWVERLTDYTISTGFDWTITSKNDQTLAKRCKVLVDRVLRQNDWTSELERESYQREVVDGESIIELEWCDGDISLSFREADELTEPANKAELERYYGIDDFVPSWSYGMLSPKCKPDRPIAYHFVRDQAGNDWDLVKACKVAHWKRNVRRRAKRGVGDFYTPHVYLLKGDKVFSSTADGTATQAAIAYIVKHGPGTTQTQASAFTSMARYTGRVDPITGVAERAISAKGGTKRLDIKGMDYYAGPLGTNNSKIYVEVMSAAMQLAGTIKAFPDGMLTGSSSGQNFASSLVQQSPFVQGRVAEQNQRANRLEKLIIKILGCYVRCGAIPGMDELDDLMRAIEIAVTPPPVIPIDKAALATSLKTQAEAGWLSDKTAMQELGRDYQTEQANLQEQAQLKAARNPQPPAMPPGAAPGAAPGGQVPGGGGVGHDPNAVAPPGSRGEQTGEGKPMPESKLSKAQRRLVEAWADYP